MTLKAGGDADGRHVGELENTVVSKERNAAIDGPVEVSEAIEEFSEQFASGGRHGVGSFSEVRRRDCRAVCGSRHSVRTDRFGSDLRNPAVNEDFASVHEAALVGGKERDDLRHFLIPTGSTEGRDRGREVEKAADLLLG